jgi:hypothetical protein
MFRKGSNMQAIHEFLLSLPQGKQVQFTVQDTLRPGSIINDLTARPGISQAAKIMGIKVKTCTKANQDGFTRLFVEKIS